MENNSSMKHIKSCDLCNKKKFSFLFKDSDKFYKIPKRYCLYKCRNCGLIFVNPQPNNKELAIHYPPDKYVSFKTSKVTKFVRLLYKIFYKENSNFFLKILFWPLKKFTRPTKIIPGAKFLDVGCGSGNFLLRMKNFGMDLHGVEPGDFNQDIVKKHKLKIFKGFLHQARFPSDYFDIITMSHVIEHVSNPTDTLRELRRILKPGGALIISLPQRTALSYYIFGKYWAGFDIPRHLYTFSLNNLQDYFKKTKLKLKKIQFNSPPTSLVVSFLIWTNKFRKEKKYFNNYSMNKLVFVFFLPITAILDFLKLGTHVNIHLTK